MQTATLIQVLPHSIWVQLLKHFSDFNFDMCHDFSFWKTETGKCIPKEMNGYPSYTFPPLCNRTEFNCMDGWFNYYCPNNKDKSCEDYNQEKHFFCNGSETCIPKGELI